MVLVRSWQSILIVLLALAMASAVASPAGAAEGEVGGAPAPPRPVSVEGDGLVQTISWTAPEHSDVTEYQVDRSTDSVNWTPVGTTASTSIEVSVPEGVHQFRVRAVNGEGTGSYAYTIPVGVSDELVRPLPLDGQISRLYAAVFRRPPDEEGFRYWRWVRSYGTPFRLVAAEFVASEEFQVRYGSLSNDEFVELLYQNVLGREPEPEGRAHWVNALEAGASRTAVLIGFSESPEFVGRTGTVPPTTIAEAEIYRLYVAILTRFPDPVGFDYWVDVRRSGASLNAIAAEFERSAEFVNTHGTLSDESFVELLFHNVFGSDSPPSFTDYWTSELSAGVFERGELMAIFAEATDFVERTGTLR